jgi:Na+/H+-dicarboxylate symporter
MKAVRYIVGVIGFFFVWLVVAVVVGLGMAILFPPGRGNFMAGISLDWRNLPGTILGLLAGIQSFRRSVRGPRKKDEKP